MDARPIGIFDSGLGGLTTVKKLTECLPGEDIVYLGDTGRVPYGSRSKETIKKYASQDAAFLAGFDIKAMVIACNTVCSVAYEAVDTAYEMPIYEVVSAPARASAISSKNGKIGVVGTAATIRSGAYEKAIKNISSGLTVYSEPCPLFVSLAENGRTSGDDIAALAIAADYLKPLIEAGVDTLIMGCTHYPLLRAVISKIMGPEVTIIDSGAETAKMVAADLGKRNLLCSGKEKGTIKYFVTDSVDGFSTLASRFLESEVSGMVEQVTIE
ncbi:MAG: glutamate racemase [Oscillospiraceae bacterium]|nr:glutamate racemase [Oscillospiraceae bacterium]